MRRVGRPHVERCCFSQRCFLPRTTRTAYETVGTTRLLASAVDQPAGGRLVPTLILKKGALTCGLTTPCRGNSAETERAYRDGIRLVEPPGTGCGTPGCICV